MTHTTDVERRRPVRNERPARVTVRAELRRRRDEIAQPRDYSRKRPYIFPEGTR